MKEKLLKTMRALCVVALLGVGTIASWADEITTFDFSGQTNESAPTLSGSDHHKAANTQQVQIATNSNFGGKFAFQSVGSGNGFYYYSNQLVQFQGERYFSIVELEAGDKIVFTFSTADASSITDKHFTVENCGTLSTTNLSTSAGGAAIAANTDLVSGTEYYVLADGYVDFKTRKNVYFDKVVITKPNSNVPDMECVWGQNFKSLGKEITFEITTDGGACTSGKAVDGDAGYYYPSADDGATAFTNENVGFYVAYASNTNHFRWKLYNGTNGLYNFKNGDNTVHIYNLAKGQILKVKGSALYNGSGVLSNWAGKDVDATIKTRYYKVDNAGTGILTVGKYEKIYSIEVFDATAYVALDQLDFEDESTATSGWSNASWVTSGTNHYLTIGVGNATSSSDYTLSSIFSSADEWCLSFEWGGYGSDSYGGESTFRIKDTNNNDIISISVPNSGNSATVTSALSPSESIGSLTVTAASSSTREKANRVSPIYRFTFIANSTDGVKLTVMKLSDSSTPINNVKVSDFVNASKLSMSFKRFAAFALDNLYSYLIAHDEYVFAPSVVLQNMYGGKPTVTAGTSSYDNATLSTCYSTSSTYDSGEVTPWTDGTSSLPAAGTYYFYTVSDQGGVSDATEYTYYGNVYEIYDFAGWYDSSSSFTPTYDPENSVSISGQYGVGSNSTAYIQTGTYYGHNLYKRFAFNTETYSSSSTGLSNSGSSAIVICNVKSGDKFIANYESGLDLRTVVKNQFVNPSGNNNTLTSGEVYTINTNGNVVLWYRNNKKLYSITIITSNNTFATDPVISYVKAPDVSTVTVTPAKVRDTFGGAVATSYYTTNGDNPTNESTEYSSTFTITESSKTVKAISYYGGVFSNIVSELVPPGEPTLAAPTATWSGMTEVGGNYYKTFTLTSDQSAVYGTPTVSYLAEYSDDDFVTSTTDDVDGITYTFSGAGKVKFYAKATDYTTSAATSVEESDEYKKTSVYDFLNDENTVVAQSASHTTYKGLPGFYVTFGNKSNTTDELELDKDGMFFNTQSSASFDLSNKLTGQILHYTSKSNSTGTYSNVYKNISDLPIDFSRYRDATHYGHQGLFEIFSPISLLSKDISDAATIDLTDIVLYSGNIDAIAAQTSACTSATTINVGQVAYGVTAAQLQSLLPSNNAFIQLPANSYLDDKTGASIKNSAGTITSFNLQDRKDYTAASAFTPTVGATYDRSFNADVVSTICLPFAINAETAATLGKFYQMKSTTTTETVVFEEVEATEALKPYLFVPAATGTITIPAGTTFAAAGDVTTQTYGNVTFNGSIASSAISSTIYGFASSGNLVTASSGTMNPFRAYLTTSGGARLGFYSFDNETTGITNANAEDGELRFYNLQGQPVAAPTNGLYIVNGKKVIIK